MSDNDVRRVFGRAVLRALRHPDFRTALPRLPDGEAAPVVVALETDTIDEVFGGVDRHADSELVVLIVGELAGRLQIVTLSKCNPESDLRTEDDCPLNGASEIGMLVALLREIRRPLHCRILAPGCNLELIDTGDPVLLPS